MDTMKKLLISAAVTGALAAAPLTATADTSNLPAGPSLEKQGCKGKSACQGKDGKKKKPKDKSACAGKGGCGGKDGCGGKGKP